MVQGTRVALSEGKQVVIFPEGTRSMVGAPPTYKTGISHLYAELDVDCTPVALNSGLLWPRRSFLRPAGHIVIQVLPTIPRGLPRKDMFDRLVNDIEGASSELCRGTASRAIPASPASP
jgi:1-acyl-sn-glycerol-3-phosphate acyltransferase